MTADTMCEESIVSGYAGSAWPGGLRRVVFAPWADTNTWSHTVIAIVGEIPGSEFVGTARIGTSSKFVRAPSLECAVKDWSFERCHGESQDRFAPRGPYRFPMISGPAFAHHSMSMYDRGHETTFKATITEFHWANPHAQITSPPPTNTATS